MPNWTWLALHFTHTLALGLWVGGIVALGALTAPVVFAQTPNPRQAGHIMATILRRFHLVVMACIVALLATSAAMIVLFGRFSPWYAIQYVCIAMMSASALYCAQVISPRIRKLHQQGLADELEFDKLHRTSVLAMQFNLACGTVALFFS